MKMMKAAIAAMAGAATLACASGANAATIYNIDVYDTTFSGSLGTVTVDGAGTSTLSFDVVLSPNMSYQAPQNGKLHDSFWFDLVGSPGFDGAVQYDITEPSPGPFSGATGSLGQGWSSGDYGLRVLGNGYYSGELKFTVTATDGSLLNLGSSTHNGQTVYGGGDFRQCLPQNETCTTGPAGFTQSSAVPEPAVWAMMLVGFGGLGAMLRYRRREVAVAA